MIDYKDLAQTRFFSGIAPDEIAKLIDCMHARCAEYAKGDFIIEEGSEVHDFGMMLSGRGRSVKWDAADKLIIITLLQKGSEIGVLLAASAEHKSPVSVQAEEDSSVLLIPYDGLHARCKKGCLCHGKLLRNYVSIVSEKGLILHERMDCLLKPTVRDKILAYLMRIARERQSAIFHSLKQKRYGRISECRAQCAFKRIITHEAGRTDRLPSKQL